MALNIQISPAGAGTVAQAVAFTWNGRGDGRSHTVTASADAGAQSITFWLNSGDGYQIESYKLTATPSAGFRFVRFDITREYSDFQGSSYTHSVSNTESPAIAIVDLPAGDPANLLGSVRRLYGRDSSQWYLYNVTNVIAVFERIPHVPTHLLVNSSSLGSPVRLVHDPATHLLVADY